MNYFKLSLITLLYLVLYTFPLNCKADEQQPLLQTKQQKLAYALGMDIGGSLKKMSQDLDIQALIQGVKDIYNGNQVLLEASQATALKLEFSNEKHREKAAKKKKIDLDNMQKNLTFLKKNKQRKNIKVTSSGLQYEILEEGTGVPNKEKWLRLNYKGYLIDGEEFFNSSDSQSQSKIEVKKQIKGLQEGLSLMPAGSKYRFYIHPRLAYGGLGYNRHIKPYDVLIFEVERIQ